jgi:hypothetical protein
MGWLALLQNADCGEGVGPDGVARITLVGDFQERGGGERWMLRDMIADEMERGLGGKRKGMKMYLVFMAEYNE